jgi:pyruvate,water dikinase
MFDIVKRILFGKKMRKASIEELREAFKESYNRFRSLLQANNRALDIIAELQTALEGTQPFGMKFVRERCARVSAHVSKIIDDMNNLAPGKYEKLYDRFNDIQSKIDKHIESGGTRHKGPIALRLSEVGKEQADQVGSKMANLGEIRNRLTLKVPDGFVITTAGFQHFMEHNRLLPKIEQRMQYAKLDELEELHALSAELQRIIKAGEIPPDLEAAIGNQYRLLEQAEGKDVRLAVRSSALREDIASATVAGQYHSSLNVKGANVLDAFKDVVASKYSPGAITYRLSLGIGDEEVDMCVGCMRMVKAVAGGVMYSRNPLNISDHSIVIDSVWGLPKPVVDGTAATDHFVVSRGATLQIKEKEIAVKEEKCVSSSGDGVQQMEMIREQGSQASITDAQALELARQAIKIEEHYQAPQDTEWCVDEDGSITIVQTRILKRIKISKQPEEVVNEEAMEGTVIAQGGITAAPGAASGPIVMVHGDMDALEFPRGAVLLVDQALPEWAILLSRAVAVISERGGVAGHLATVAREFGVPAIFSLNDATELLEPGRIVTVDADSLRIYDGQVDEILKREETKTNLMEGSPAYEMLKSAADHIAPLNLLDPDNPLFAPEKCTTLHDITRFCHEKATHEMFNFGKDHHLPERSGRRLYTDVAMQWLVLNLEDGFKEGEDDGKFIRLENIDSIPMLALWEGISAIPWAGPPPIDGKGLVSVMFQATQNRDLITSTRSKYADQHYFMVSKRYCCLSSRLGFHFASVEAMVGDRPEENYISFRFMGGAADYDRRRKRVFFVKEILEGYHFKVDVKKDNLVARMEGYDKDFMVRNLKIVGYLAIHTRQLDMIMSKPSQVKHYRNKICKDIQELFVGEKVLYVYLGDKEE